MCRVANWVFAALVSASLLAGSCGWAKAAEGAPWWRQQKIVFMWGQWGHSRADKSDDFWRADLPRRLFRDVATAGATVFVELRWYNPNNARLAHEFGMKYFATKFQSDVVSPALPGRFFVDESGREQVTKAGYKYKCPLDEAVYDKWLVEPHLEGARAGLIDGIHVDWEDYGGNGEAKGVCYCRDCFATYVERRGVKADAPGPGERFAFLEKRDLVKAYGDSFHHRRIEMFASLREQLQAVKADLIFSSYDIKPAARMTVLLRAWNTPEVPLIWLDQRHYANDDRQAWWESYSDHLRKEGCLYLPGGWTNALFGMQASLVSAARWIYEAAINEDGCWLWFERELDDEILRAYAAADRELKAVQSKVGEYLLRAARDPSFATAVMTCGYHLDDDHLVHVNNVHTEWLLRTRIRFPRLPAADKWTVRDPLTGLYYTHDERKSAMWTTAQLHAGVVIAMEPRSDRFLLISRASGKANVDASRLIRSRSFSVLPEHGKGPAARSAGAGGSSVGRGGLVYTATEPMGLEGSDGPLTLGNAIRTMDADGKNQKRLRQLRGHLWSPRYSPDGKRIAFVHDTGCRGQICVMNADGSDATNISKNEFCDRDPVWSPGGDRIAFVSDRDGDWNIYLMNGAGSNQVRLADHPGLDRAPTWSPDGKRIAWESHVSGMPTVWVCDADGKNSRPLIRPDRPFKALRWDGVESGSFPSNTVSGMSDNTIRLTDPLWSPDGKHIAAMELSMTTYDQVIAVISADGSGLQRVVGLQSITDFCWSPDGARLAGASRVHGGSYGTERSGIFFVNRDGPYGPTWIYESTQAIGPRIGGAPAPDMLTWYAHGSARPRRVIKSFSSLAWSPDGKRLAFSSDVDPSGAFYVYTVPVKQKAQPKRIDSSKSAWPQQVMWRPR